MPGGRPAGDDGPEDEIVGQQVPKFVADGGLVDLTAVNGLLQDVLIKAFRCSSNWCCMRR